MKKYLFLLILPLLISAGRLQNVDFMTEAELVTAGSSASALLNDTKVYITGNGINKTLDDAIADGDIGFQSPLSVAGDILYYNAGHLALGIGTEGQLLTVQSGLPVWADAPVSTTLTTKGELQGYGTANEAVPAPTADNQILVGDTASSTGLKWVDSVVNISQAHFVGYLKWESTTNCLWSNNSLSYNVFANDVDCDDNARTVFGDVTDIQNGLKPHVGIPNARTDGTYKITYLGAFYKAQNSSNTCKYRLVGDETTTQGNVGASTSTNFSPMISFQTRFTSTGTKELEMHVSSGNGTDNCHIDLRGSRLEISVEFMPDSDSTAVVQNTELDATTANEFSAKLTSSGAIISENYNWLASCSNTSGDGSCSFESGVFTQKPSCICNVNGTSTAGDRTCQTHSISTSGLSFITVGNASKNAYPVEIYCSKQGADVNKSQTIVGTFENINSTDLLSGRYTNDATIVLTASTTTTLDYGTKQHGNIDAHYNASTGVFTSPRNTCYIFSGAVIPISVSADRRPYLQLLKNGTTSLALSSDVTSFITNPLVNLNSGIICLNQGDTVELRAQADTVDRNVNAGLDNFFSIQELPDYEAIVKNLYDNTTKCQFKDNGGANIISTAPVAGLSFSNLVIGKKYLIKLSARMETFASGADASLILDHNGSEVIRVGNVNTSGVTGSRITAGNSKIFTATATTLDARVAFSNGGYINGGSYGTFTELCELPDSYVNTTEF